MPDANGDNIDDVTHLPIGGVNPNAGKAGFDANGMPLPGYDLYGHKIPESTLPPGWTVNPRTGALLPPSPTPTSVAADSIPMGELFKTGDTVYRWNGRTITKATVQETNAFNNGDTSGGGSAATYATIAENRRQFDLEFGLEQQKMGEDTRQFDLTTAEGRRQFDAQFDYQMQKDAADLGFDYASLNQREQQSLRDLAYQYYNTTADFNAARMQARATLIQGKQNAAIDLAQLAQERTKVLADLAANPRDWTAFLNYENAMGGATPFGSTDNPFWGQYQTSLDKTFQRIAAEGQGDLAAARNKLNEPIPDEYLNAMQVPQVGGGGTGGGQVYGPGGAGGGTAGAGGVVTNAAGVPQKIGATNLTGQVQSGVRAAVDPNNAVFRPGLNGMMYADPNVDPNQQGSVMYDPQTGGWRPVTQADIEAYNQQQHTYLLNRMGTDQSAITTPGQQAAVTAGREGIASALQTNGGALPGLTGGTGNLLGGLSNIATDLPKLMTPEAQAGFQAQAQQAVVDRDKYLASIGKQMATVNGVTQAVPIGTATGGTTMLPTTSSSYPTSTQTGMGAYTQSFAKGGQLDFDGLYNSRSGPGYSPPSSEGGTNLNIHERAVIVGESGQVYATLGERRPDGTMRAEQLMIKPLKSEVAKDKQLEEQGKQAVEQQKKTLKSFAEGGAVTASSGADFLDALRRQIFNLSGVQPAAGQTLQNPSALASSYGMLKKNPDLYNVIRSGYSKYGISPDTLDYTLGQFQPTGFGQVQTRYI